MPPQPSPDLDAVRLHDPYDLLTASADPGLDDLTRVAARVCEAPRAFIGHLDSMRLCFKSQQGAKVVRLAHEAMLCSVALATPEMLVVSDALLDPRFRFNRADNEAVSLRFFAGMPIRGRSGHAVAVLGVVDHKPRELSPGQAEALRSLARQVESIFELRLLVKEGAAREAVLRNRAEELLLLQKHRDALVSLIVHDLKNPLTGIMGYAELGMNLSSGPSRERDIFLGVEDAARRMTRLVNDILDLARGSGALSPHPVDILWAELASEVSRLFGQNLHAAGRSILIEPCDPGARLRVDRELMLRVLQNLVDNALKYSPHGGEVRLSFRAVPGGAEIRVSDQGIGIPEHLRERVFDPFQRAGNVADIRGQGLGLAFCRLAIEAHGGTIDIEPVAHGTTFCIHLNPTVRPPVREKVVRPDASPQTGWTGAFSLERPAGIPPPAELTKPDKT